MTRSGPFRMLAAVAAIFLSFSSSGVAASHALTHAHLAKEHGAAQPFAQPTVEDGDHSHGHDHVSIDTAPTVREGLRFDTAPAALSPVLASALEIVHDVPRHVRTPALLPRPGPDLGPPGGPRAPPTA